MRLNFATRTEQARSAPHSVQRLVNVYAEAGNEKDPVVLYGTPGTVDFATPGSGPIRGMRRMVDTLYVVSGEEVYTVASDGTATLLDGVPVDGSGPVHISDNGTQVVIVTNQTTGYVVTTTVDQITDPDFPGASGVVFLDGYSVFTRPNTQVFFISNLNAAGTITGTDFASAEASPDNLVTLCASGRNVFLFGDTTTEVWFNSGQSSFPLSRRTSMERGIIGQFACVAADNTVFWMGEDRNIYRNEGFVPRRISTHAIEEQLRDVTVSDCQAWTYGQGGHRFVGFTFPTAGLCFVYDAASGLWHERASYGLDRWRFDTITHCYGKVLAGSYNSNAVYELDLDSYTEAGGILRRQMISPALSNEYSRGTVHSLFLDIEAGNAEAEAMLRFSKDGGRTWSNELWREFGPIGEYGKRAIWRRLGQFGHNGIVFDVTVSDAAKLAVLGAYIEAEGNAL